MARQGEYQPVSDETDAPEVSAYFFVSGRDFNPDDCTDAFELTPTEIWKQRHKHLLARTDLPNVCWKYGVKKLHVYSVSDAVDEVLKVVWPAHARIKKYVSGKALKVGVACSVTIYDDRPVYDLSVSTIEKLADIGCEFSLDIFDYSE